MSGNTSASEGFVERWLGDLSDIEKAFSQEVRLVNSKQGAFTRGKCSISKKFWGQSDYYISLGDDSNAQKFLDGLYKTLAKIKLKPSETQFTIFVQNVFLVNTLNYPRLVVTKLITIWIRNQRILYKNSTSSTYGVN